MTKSTDGLSELLAAQTANIPLMTQRQFAQLTGLDAEGKTIIHGMIQRKALPTFKLGKHRMIDMDGLREMIAAAREQQ